jgi:probable phosphoglycerate mutase
MNSLRCPTGKPAPEQEFRSDVEDATIFLLIRHGHTDAIGQRRVGRRRGVGLTQIGRLQAARLAARLREQPIASIYSSPLERAVQTAEPLARAFDLPVRTCDALLEVDFGQWTGLTFDELDERADWRRFNSERASAPVPGGETALAVQTRIVRALTRLRARHPSQTIAAISHADVIRAAILHFAALPLDLFHRFEIDPASVTALRLGHAGSKLLGRTGISFSPSPVRRLPFYPSPVRVRPTSLLPVFTCFQISPSPDTLWANHWQYGG